MTLDAQAAARSWPPSLVLRFAGCTALCAVATTLAAGTVSVHPSAASLALGSGAALGALVVCGVRLWPAVVLGTLLGHLATGDTAPAALPLAAGAGLAAWAGAAVFLRETRSRVSLQRVRDTVALVFLATLVSALVNTLGGALHLLLDGTPADRSLALAALAGWGGEVSGTLVVAPALIVWAARPLPEGGRRDRLEMAAMLASGALIAFAALHRLDGSPSVSVPQASLLFPFALWAALRLGQHGASALTLVLGGVAAATGLESAGPLVTGREWEAVLSLQALLSVVGATGMILAALGSERRRSRKQRERLLLRERAARAEAEAAGGQARFLAEVSELLATSLDVEATLRSLAYLTVPRLGDSCIVYLVGDDGEIRRLDAMHVDPEKERALREQLQRHPPQLESLIPPVARALRSGTPEIVREVTPAALKAHPGDPTHRGIAEEVGLRSLIVVPLIARGRTLGALSYGVQHPRPRFGDADLPLATEVARKAALALDNSRLYAASQRAVATREKVLAVVCHDLRNPLGTILLSSTALSRSSPTEVWAEAGPELLASIAASAEQMEYLIKDLADLTRLETGRVALARSRHEPWQLLDEAVLVLSPLARAGGLRLVCDPVGDLPGVRVARDRIIQVFSNLVGNAIKATPPGGTITLGAHRWGTGVCFSVADDGPGMPPEKAARLFDRFWESTLTGRSEFGLGLHITRALIDAHGGRVWAESTPGEGTTVRFTVGAAERRESASGEAAALGAA